MKYAKKRVYVYMRRFVSLKFQRLAGSKGFPQLNCMRVLQDDIHSNKLAEHSTQKGPSTLPFVICDRSSSRSAWIATLPGTTKGQIRKCFNNLF